MQILKEEDTGRFYVIMDGKKQYVEIEDSD
jgi:hypothetical protein